MSLLEIRDLTKSFPGPDGATVRVLDVPEFRLEAAEQVALAGESGAGKTTFLHLIAGILVPDAGSVRIGGVELMALTESARDAFRARHIGYVFQTFHLLPAYSALENVLLGMTFGPGPDRAAAQDLLVRLGLGDRLHHRPSQLSVGQRQRVAVARALAHRPRLVLADEPTGNLDSARAAEALDLLTSLCRDAGAALLLVTHDPRALARFERRLDLATVNRAAPGTTG